MLAAHRTSLKFRGDYPPDISFLLCPGLSLRVPRRHLPNAGIEAFHHPPFEVFCQIHPHIAESIEALGKAPVDEPRAVKRLKHSERAGKRDFEDSGPPSSTAVIDDRYSFSTDFESKSDSLSLSSV